MHFLDVGQGDCTIIIDRATNAAIVIACPGRQAPTVLARLRDLGAPGVALIVITHWDFDHYGGALEVATQTRCRLLVFNRDTLMAHPVDKTIRRAQLRRLLEEPLRSMPKRSAPEGTAGQIGNVGWRTLAPSENELIEAVTEHDRNLASIVVQASAHGRTVMIASDADTRVWQRLISEGVHLEADIFRWPHHGGELRGGAPVEVEDLLDRVRPTFVPISVGTKNTYGHPDRVSVEAISARANLACTQVTSKCHRPSGLSSPTPCGGDLSFTIDAGGGLHPTGGWIGHEAVVAGWDHPMCLSEQAS
ncbi:MAG: ComEC/Rec2 family competence protein [Dehalococcoidia bacterium]